MKLMGVTLQWEDRLGSLAINPVDPQPPGGVRWLKFGNPV